MTNVKRIEPVQNTQPATTLLPPNTLGGMPLKSAAQYLGISEISVRRLCKRGLLKPNRGLKKLIFPVRELNRYLEG
jgi:Helix-turn-helix domain